MIIVEGPDGAGKTTLVGKLKQWNPTLIEVYRGPREGLGTDAKQTEWLWSLLSTAVDGRLVPRICDRLYVSELVYGPLWRDENVFEKQQGTIEHLMLVLRIPTVFCLPPYETVLNNAKEDDQLPKVSETIVEVYDSYRYWYDVLKRQGLNVVHYDYTDRHVREAQVDTVVKEYIEVHKKARQ